MALKDILQDEIKKNNMTIKKISELSREIGVPITESYISQLKNGKQTSPSEDVLNTLSEILGISHNTLLIQSYYDRAPSSMKEFLDNMNLAFNLRDYSLKTPDTKSRAAVDEEIESKKQKILHTPYYSFIESINSQKLSDLALSATIMSSVYIDFMDAQDFSKKSEENPDMSYEEIMDITKQMTFDFDTAKDEMNDDSMAPLIDKGEVFIIDGKAKDYSKGDIVLILDESNHFFSPRKYQKSGEKIFLLPVNDSYDIMEFDEETMQIMGKVHKLIKNI